jgi:membrane protein DedA with SNARE-associated domain
LATAIRSELAFASGATRLPWRRFAVWNGIGCLAWALVAALAGRVLGRFVEVEPLLDAAERWSVLLTVVLLAAAAAYLGLRLLRGRRNPQKHQADR